MHVKQHLGKIVASLEKLRRIRDFGRKLETFLSAHLDKYHVNGDSLYELLSQFKGSFEVKKIHTRKKCI